MIKNDLDGEIMKELSGIDLHKDLGMIMEESPRISTRRKNLKRTFDSLIESQKEVAMIIHQVGEVEWLCVWKWRICKGKHFCIHECKLGGYLLHTIGL